MRYRKIRKMDIADGPGVRVSLFFQGCDFHCKGCFNPETWGWEGGEEFTDSTIEKILNLADHEYIQGLSILGGEPMHPKNIMGTYKLAKAFKEKYPDKTVWSWTGFLYDNIVKPDVLNYLDVLVDGQFKEELFNPKLKYCGSSNQRVIDVQKTLKEGEIILFTE